MDGSKEKVMLRRLRALDEFHCLGADCPDNCCHGWRVEVDVETFDRWRDVEQDLRTWLQAATEPADATSRKAHHLRTMPDGGCYFQERSGLCALQRRMGHEWLPETCRSYPRADVRGARVRLQTAHLSCPEVVAIVHAQLRAGEPAFAMEETHTDVTSIWRDPVLDEVQILLGQHMQLLMSGSGALGVRLYYLAGILAWVQEKAVASTLDARSFADKLGKRPEDFYRRLEKTTQLADAGKLGPSAAIRQRYWAHVLKSGKVFDRPWAKSLLSASPLPALLAKKAGNHRTDTQLRELVAQRQATINTRYPSVLALLERYLEIKFWNHGFPWQPFAGNYTATFLDCVIPLSQCILLLWLLAEHEDQPLDDSTVETVIYSVERSISHNTDLFDYVRQHPFLMEPNRYRDALLELC